MSIFEFLNNYCNSYLAVLVNDLARTLSLMENQDQHMHENSARLDAEYNLKLSRQMNQVVYRRGEPS